MLVFPGESQPRLTNDASDDTCFCGSNDSTYVLADKLPCHLDLASKSHIWGLHLPSVVPRSTCSFRRYSQPVCVGLQWFSTPQKETANSTGVCCSSCCSPRTLRSDMQGKPLDTQRLSICVLLTKLFQSRDRYVLHGSHRTPYCERFLQVSLF